MFRVQTSEVERRAFAALYVVALLCAVLPWLAALADSGDRALLIGVGRYQGDVIEALPGVGPDLEAMQRVVQQRFDIPAERIVVLQDASATRANILREIKRLPELTQVGDKVFVYFSGHGTSGRNPSVPDLSRLIPSQSGALIPYDVHADSALGLYDSLVVGRRDLRPTLEALDQGGRDVLVFFDSCYSGQAVRSVNAKLKTRSHDFVFSQAARTPFASSQRRTEYPYQNVLFLAAAGESEQALDLQGDALSRWPTHDGRSHGAFTDALVRVLDGEVNADINRDGTLTGREIARGVSCFMNRRQYPHSPQVLPAPGSASERLLDVALTNSERLSVSTSQELLRIDATALSDSLRSSLAQIERVEFNSLRPELIFESAPRGVRALTGAGDFIASLPASARALRERVEVALWSKAIHESHCRGLGPNVDLMVGWPSQGSTFEIGERVSVEFRADTAAKWLLLDINAHAEIHVLYPAKAQELETVPASHRLRFPDQNEQIVAQEPEGLDHLIAIAFRSEPEFLAAMVNGAFTMESPEIRALQAYLKNNEEQTGVAAVDLRVVAR